MNRVVQLPARNSGCVDQVEQERDVRLHPAHAELLQSPLHPPGRIDEPPPRCADLDQQRIVERRDDATRDRRAAVEPDPQPADRTDNA